MTRKPGTVTPLSTAVEAEPHARCDDPQCSLCFCCCGKRYEDCRPMAEAERLVGAASST